MTISARSNVPQPLNEPIQQYAPGASQRISLEAKLTQMSRERIEIPCMIGGKAVHTGLKKTVVMPHSHGEVLAEFHMAGPKEMEAAARAALKAKAQWENLPWESRAAVFLKAADLLAGPYRDTINAATMLGQSKTVFQSEIDAACEFVDFLRFNASFYAQILADQPISSSSIYNRVEYRALEGFVLALTPFNFTAIAGNLCASPALLGNTVVWKPSDTQILSAHYTYQIFKEAGLPDGVINLVPSEGPMAGQTYLKMHDLAGIHFTGSTQTFQTLWRGVAENISNYKSYPRVVGETGGKDFVFAHMSADIDALVTALVRGAFEYQGQKCSAASRAYIPKSIWPTVKSKLVETIKQIKMGDVRDFSCFMSAVIDERSYQKITSYIEFAKNAADAKVIAGGGSNKEKGYFIEPTLIETTNPHFKTMKEEIFGPVLTVFAYDDSTEQSFEDALTLCDQTSPYALTGAIFAQDRLVIQKMSGALKNSAGNFYINDKPTGAVVGQQPFGGARASGTNDKAGSMLNLLRWTSVRTVKEALVSPKSFRYPHMG